MSDDYARAAARVAAAQLAEAAGFDCAKRSSLEVLSDLLLRYIQELGSSSHAYAELAGRAESNALDVTVALKDLGVSIADLQEYVELQEDIPFGQTISEFPVRKKATATATFASRGEAPPAHIPAFFPAFPDKHAYVSTELFAAAAPDAARRQLKGAEQRQAGEEALVKLAGRLQPDSALLKEDAAVAAPAPAAPAAKDKAKSAAVGNPFLGLLPWEEPQPVEQAALDAGGPVAPAELAVAAAREAEASGGEPGPTEVQWKPVERGAEQAGARRLGAPVSWDWAAELQKRARLSHSGGPPRDAYEDAPASLAGGGQGRRAKRARAGPDGAPVAHDATKGRVSEILAVAGRQETAATGAAGPDEEQVGPEHI